MSYLCMEVFEDTMFSLSILSFLSLITAFSTPQPVARVDRLYWDHVEGFYLADSVGREIYAGSRNRLYYSSDFGQSWTHLGDLPKVTLIRQIIPIDRRTIFINSSKGIYGVAFLSTDSGRSYCVCLPSTGAGNCAYFDSAKHTLYVACEKPFKLMRSEDSGFTWTPEGSKLDSTIGDPHVCSLLVSNDDSGRKFYISTSIPAAIYCRPERENAWNQCFIDPIKIQSRELPLVTKWGKRLVACVTSGPNSSSEKIFLSDDRAVTWRSVNCPFEIWGVGVNASDLKTLWAGNYGNWLNSKDSIALQYTQDEGLTWRIIPNCGAQYFWQLQELADGSLYAATDFGLMRIKLN
jgi:hypothetical protein